MTFQRITLALAASLVVATPAFAQTKLKWAHVYETSEPFHTASVWAAEEIKKRIGSAFPGAEVREMEVKGRNLAEGIPRSFTISSLACVLPSSASMWPAANPMPTPIRRASRASAAPA